jgi:glycosyltransferase involved in cell wall biosynthesis
VKRRLRVLRIITRLNIGGPALHVILLNSRLDPATFQSLLVCGKEGDAEGSLLGLAVSRGIQPIVLPSLGRAVRPLNDLSTTLRLVSLMRELRPDVVHTHMAKAGTAGRLAARIAGVPIIVHTYHGHVFHSYFSPNVSAVFRGVERALAKVTDRVIAIGETQRHDIMRYDIAPPEKIEVIPLGLELDRFRDVTKLRGSLRRELGLQDDHPLIGIVARLVPIKAHEVFLEAAANVLRQVPRARFIIVGDGERRHELEQLANALGIGGATYFLGWRAELEQVYADLDVVTLTSLNEGSPVALIEAMTAGRPVVSTDVGGVREVIQDGVSGLLVPPHDSPQLARAIVQLLDDSTLSARLGRAAQSAAYPRYASGRLLREVESLYLRIAREKGLAACP